MLGSKLLVTYGSVCVLRRLFHFMDVFFAVFVVYKLMQGQKGPLIVFLRTWERLGLTSSSSSFVPAPVGGPVVRSTSWCTWSFTRCDLACRLRALCMFQLCFVGLWYAVFPGVHGHIPAELPRGAAGRSGGRGEMVMAPPLVASSMRVTSFTVESTTGCCSSCVGVLFKRLFERL